MTRLVRNPNRHSGKAHRFDPGTPGATLCGKSTRDMTETIPFTQSDPADLCRQCEKRARRTR